ncbi:MAG: hypothetical protein JNL25_18345 [Rhodospirillaceae bacterium]|nr:hypothetical protein [Rhodospirillaceae bacterium]
MIRIGTLIWIAVLGLLSVGLFQVKYAVQAKENELKSVNRQITADRQILRVLEAEWSYLNDPVRLADLTRRHTDLAPIMAGQIASFADLRARPPVSEVPAEPTNQPPIAALPNAPIGQPEAIPAAVSDASATVAAPAQPTPVFQTSAGSEPVDEDATIRAILADMEAKQAESEAALPVAGGEGAQ